MTHEVFPPAPPPVSPEGAITFWFRKVAIQAVKRPGSKHEAIFKEVALVYLEQITKAGKFEKRLRSLHFGARHSPAQLKMLTEVKRLIGER